MDTKKSLIVVTCPSSGVGHSYVNELLMDCAFPVELLDTYTSASGNQIFFLLFLQNNLQDIRKKIGKMYQDESAWSDIETHVVDVVLNETLEALAGLPAAAVDGPVIFVESRSIGRVIQSLNRVLTLHSQEIVLGDVEVGLAKGGKAIYFFSAPLSIAETLSESLRMEFPDINISFLKKMHPALKAFFTFTTSVQ
jgi:hypothetical protein